MLTAEQLLAGAELTFEIAVPEDVLQPAADGASSSAPLASSGSTVRLRPLRVNDLQRISRAAKESDQMLATLMVQQALVEPALTVAQTASLPVGLMQFLLDQVNHISGMGMADDDLAERAAAPLARAAHILAREYGWTPDAVNDLTLGQVLLHLRMLKDAS